MGRLKNTIKPFLPLGVLDFRHRVRDIRGYLDVRGRYENQPSRWNLIASLLNYIQPPKTILFYPERPAPLTVEYKLCALLGYAITTNPKHEFDVAFKRMNTTIFDPALLRGIPTPREKIINAGSADISKKAVSALFENVFGYALDVDPMQYEGKLVEKSNSNFTHDGRVLQGPLTPADIKEDKVYQKLIDNSSVGAGLVTDYRVPIHGRQIPLVYLKHRPVETRFSNVNASAELTAPNIVLSTSERDKLLLLARRMGVDYGEFDVLRDRDGRIYVVDVNNTPVGPPNGLPIPECRLALERMKISFDEMLERHQL
jgi:hypothetical protein